MSTVVVDAGHGGKDPGAQAYGYAESWVVLPWATELARVLRRRGHEVILTRDSDVFVELAERARIANDAGADLFVSLHANAGNSPGARGPWSIYAAPSAEGRRIAASLQGVLAVAMQGTPDAVFPDESGWVGGRRLAVLRQTKMPAVLVELGFMTNPKDLSMLRDPDKRRETCASLAVAIGEALRVPVKPPEIPAPSGELAAPSPAPPVHDPPNLERIIVPTPEHIDEAVRVSSRWDADTVRDGIALVEVILRGMQRGNVKSMAPKILADVLSEWLTRR